MSRPKGRKEHQTVAALPIYVLILKWGVSVVFIAKALPWASVILFRSPAKDSD